MRYLGIVLVIISSIVYAEESATLPITKVILYKHGVGYFERSGKVKDNEVINLTFKKEEMPDVLKSIVAMDLGEGDISLVEYDSIKPLDKVLSGFSINLSGEANIISLLNQIKGAPIEIKVGTEVITGTFLGLRKREIYHDDTVIEQDILDLTNEDGVLKSFLLDDIKEITIKEPQLQKEVQDCLNTIFQYRAKELKRISIVATGKGEREVVIGYIVETPVWKTSYRVVVTKDEKPFFQGWAIVDNVSDEDWSNISLSLVSGLPVSFIQDLYTPHYRKRPVIELEKDEIPAPVVAEEALYEMEGRGGFVEELAVSMEAKRMPMAAGLKKTQEVSTITQEVGDLFEYKIDYPVSILRNRSALIPIVGTDIEGERVSLYNESTRPFNPMSAVWLKNITGLTLEVGPITVYEDESYAGEAIMNTVKPDEKFFITYAVDLGVKVSTSRDSERRNVHHVSIIDGTLYAYYKEIDIKKYTITNKTVHPKKVIIEHPFRSGWKLVEPQRPLEETENYYRFGVDLEPQKTSEFIVREENVFYEIYVLTNLTPEDILVLIDKNYVSPEVKDVFNKIIELKRRIIQLNKGISEKEKHRQEIFKDQERIRENLKALKDTPAEKKLAEDYVNKLTMQEGELKTIQQEIETLKTEKEKYQRELDDVITEVSFEKDI